MQNLPRFLFENRSHTPGIRPQGKKVQPQKTRQPSIVGEAISVWREEGQKNCARVSCVLGAAFDSVCWHWGRTGLSGDASDGTLDAVERSRDSAFFRAT